MIDELYFGTHYRVITAAAQKTCPPDYEMDDWVNEIAMRVWKHRGTYRPERGRFTTWVYKIALMLRIAKSRKQKHKIVSIQSLIKNSGKDYDFEAKPNGTTDQQDLMSDVAAAIQKLTPARQTIINAWMRGEKSIAYAKLNKVSKQRANQLLNTALVQLHRILWRNYKRKVL